MSNVTYVHYLPWPGRQQTYRFTYTGAGLSADRASNDSWDRVSYEETQKILNFIVLQTLGFVVSVVKVVPEEEIPSQLRQ